MAQIFINIGELEQKQLSVYERPTSRQTQHSRSEADDIQTTTAHTDCAHTKQGVCDFVLKYSHFNM